MFVLTDTDCFFGAFKVPDGAVEGGSLWQGFWSVYSSVKGHRVDYRHSYIWDDNAT